MIQNQILHVCLDEKFNRIVINQFNEISTKLNQYLIVSEDGKLKYPIDEDKGNILITSFSQAKIIIKRYKYLIFHSLYRTNAQLAASLKHNQEAAWFSWGGDILKSKELIKSYHEPITLKKWEEKISNSETISLKTPIYDFLKNHFPSIRSSYFKFRTGNYLQEEALKRAYSKIKYVSTVLEEELRDVEVATKRGDLIYLDYTYGDIEILTKGADIDKLGDDILIGHSGFLENNHLDLFPILAKSSGEVKFQLLLNYGNPDDINLIKNEALKTFGDRVYVIEEFLNTENFIRLLSNCSTLFLNTIQQQAVGILYLASYFGLKIYLNSKGHLYQHCKKNGLMIFSIDKGSNIDFSPLSREFKKKNKEVILSLLDKDVILKRTKIVMETILNK